MIQFIFQIIFRQMINQYDLSIIMRGQFVELKIIIGYFEQQLALSLY